MLATNVGSDLFILDNEIEKLVLYRNGQTLRPIDVESCPLCRRSQYLRLGRRVRQSQWPPSSAIVSAII